jgi:hypothetical protein
MMPDDLRLAYQNFTMLALERGYIYAALMICKDPIDALVIGNVNERGHDLAQLLRMHADYLDQKVNRGEVVIGELPSNAN